MNDSLSHPTLTQFRKALDDRAVSPDKAVAFNKWRNNPDKCTGPLKEAADKLWAEYESIGSAAQSAVPSSRPAHAPNSSSNHSRPGKYHGNSSASQPQRADNVSAAKPDILGEPFHNPYSFIPFPATPPRRHAPTPLTVDELDHERERFTGILDLNVKLLSPLLTNAPIADNDQGGHKSYHALTVGDDVILPATGVRGALRTLMTVLTGGTLGYIDDEAWLCQGRDARLGPDAMARDANIPCYPHLGLIIRTGGYGRHGYIQLGKTVLVDLENIAKAICRWKGLEIPPQVREPGKRPQGSVSNEYLQAKRAYQDYLRKLENIVQPYRPHYDAKQKRFVYPKLYASISEGSQHAVVECMAHEQSDQTPWMLKLSMRPINLGERRPKKEGAFLATEKEPHKIAAQHWANYLGRHRHADHNELREGDLVWLRPKEPGVTKIVSGDQIDSIQWARWGREGENLLNIIRQRHPHQLPDSFNPDGLVDEVTDLFGQIPRDDIALKAPDKAKPAFAFAARIRPCNLVFTNAKSKVQRVTLAPLAPPHPGCAAFYREVSGNLAKAADVVCNHNTRLRGYKIYRTTSERGSHAPWRYETQGVYGNQGQLSSPQQKVNKTCELLPDDTAPTGTLRITVRALSQRELTLLLAACAVDWRLGGGKPLGLGHCRVVSAVLRPFNDDGSLGPALSFQRTADVIAPLPEPYAQELAADTQLVERMQLWQTSQTPVQKLRYPRAVIENRNKKSRGGHVWFGRHASPRKAVREGAHPQGLQVLHLGGDLRDEARADALRAQPLPPLEPGHPEADVLYGYDLFAGDSPQWTELTCDRRTLYRALEPFDPEKHKRTSDHSGGHHGQSRDSRQEFRRQRR